jgi:hypothetical protein
MRNTYMRKFGAILVAIAIIVALALITMPELRALLLLVDYLGLELIALLLATQMRSFIYLSLPAASSTISALCELAFHIGSGAMRACPKTFHWTPFDKLVCPALVFATYGVRCGSSFEA